ncbi:Uncharacterized protein HZ326_29972 [Fusarium oxysporum f. sp. albedinis]|nr:Uncharacterized protein HZ326_29972 [Fusarium oxysporum f. sp. albedinis]
MAEWAEECCDLSHTALIRPVKSEDSKLRAFPFVGDRNTDCSSSISEPSLATPTLENDMISAYKPSSCHYHVESRGCSYWRRYNRLGGDVREELHQNSPTSLTQILAKINSYLKNNAFVDYKNDWS